MSTQSEGAAAVAPTSPEMQEATQRQSEALEVSGWGERFTLVQPHNLCFWVYLWLMVVGIFQGWSFFQAKAVSYPEALAVSAVLTAIFGGAWWLWLRHIDRWERQPVGLVLAGAAWGAIAATFAFALTVNDSLLTLYAKVFGQDWASSWAAGFTAPFTEELAKVCGFILLMGLAPKLVRSANDGLVIGAFIGLGFAALEDFLYAVNSIDQAFGTDPVGSAVQISATRFSVGFVSHPLFSALVCTGVIYVVGTRAQPRRIGRGIAFILAGMFLHFTWDNAGGLGNHGAGVVAVLAASTIAAFIILALAFRAAAPREHQFVRDILAPEVVAGTVSAQEVDAVVDKHARKALKKAAHGHRAKKALKHLRHAILDLTHDVADAQGTASSEVEFARAEVARLRAAAGTAAG